MDRKLIGFRFKSLRHKKGFVKQVDMIRDFKEKTGINLPKSNLSMYEKGTRLPEYELMGKFADYFNVTLDFLQGRSEADLSTVKSTLKNLATLFEKLSENDRAQAIKYMEFLNLGKKV